MKNNPVSIAMIVVASLFWGVIGVFSRELQAFGLSPIQVTEIRCIAVSIFITLAIAVYDKKLLRIRLKDLWMFFGSGVIGIISFNVLYFESNNYVTLSTTAVLLYTAPFFVLLMSVIIFKEKLTKQKIAALVIAFTGCVLIAGLLEGGSGFNGYGFLLGLGSGVGYALYTIFGKYALKTYHPLTLTLYTFLVAGICLIPFSDIPQIVDVAIGSQDALMWMIGLGLLITTLPYLLYNLGLNGLDAGVASVVAFLEPMVATIAGFIIYNETPSILDILGILMILFAIILLNIEFKPKGAENTQSES